MIKKQLTEAIREGIDKSYPVVFLRIVLITAFIISLIYIAIFIYDIYFYEDCIETGECVMAYVSLCEKVGMEDLSCRVKIGNETKEWDTGHFTICGYQEANAFYEQIKPKIEMDLKEYHSTWKIKYLECNEF